MNREFFKQKIKDTVKSFEINGDKYYYRVPGALDANLFEIMSSDREQNDKLIDVLLSCICDESGLRIFDSDSVEDRRLVIALDNDIQIEFINGLREVLFPGK